MSRNATRIDFAKFGTGAGRYGFPSAETLNEVSSGDRAGARVSGPFSSQDEFERQYFRPGKWNVADLKGESSFLTSLNPWDRGKKFYDGTESNRPGDEYGRPAPPQLNDDRKLAPARRTNTVYTPSGLRKVRLFGTSAADYSKRHDCEKINGVWVCVYSDRQYSEYRRQIIKNEQLVGKADKEANKALEELKNRIGPKNLTDQQKLEAELDRTTKPTEDELKKLRQTNAQHALFLKFKDISQMNSMLMPGALAAAKMVNGTQLTDWDMEQANQTRPKKMILYADAPEFFVNSIVNPYGAGDFFCADPGQLAALIPTVDFYLSVGASKKGEEIYERVAFSDFTSGQKIKALGKLAYSDPTAVLKDRGTLGTDVGITSFDWEWENKHSGDRVLNASLKLHFQSIRELNNQKYLDFVFMYLRNQPGVPSSASGLKSLKDFKRAYANPVERSKEIKKIGLAAVDFDSDEMEKSYQSMAEKIPTVMSNQLKVIVGWATPTGPGANDLIKPNFRAALDRSRKTLILNLIKYDLDFGQNGQVDLTLSYNGSLDTFIDDLNQSNIFEMNDIAKETYVKPYAISALYKGKDSEEADDGAGTTGGKNGVVKALEWITGKVVAGTYKESISPGELNNPTLTKIEAGPGVIRTRGVFGTQKVEVSKDKFIDEPSLTVRMSDVDEEIARLKMLSRYWKLRQAQRLGRRLKPSAAIKRNEDNVEGWLNAALTIKTSLNVKMSADRNSALLKSLVQQGRLYYATINRNFVAGNVGFRSNFIKIRNNRVEAPAALADRAAKAVRESVEKKKKPDKKPENPIFALDPLTPRDQKTNLKSEIPLYYFRLGDLIDLILDSVPNRANLELVMGTFRPGRLGIPDFETNMHASIADIPISLDYFSQWFLENISKTGRTQISIRSFMDLLLHRLVAPLFNSAWNKRIESGATNDRIYFDFTATTLPYEVKQVITTAGTMENEIIDYVCFQSQILIANKNFADRFGDRNEKTNNVLLVFADHNGNSKFLEGNRVTDELQGIYHLILGSECNVVKNFSFTEKRMPQLRAQMIENNRHMNGLTLSQDCDITMYGNTFFRNGSLLYINAEFGLGAAAEGLGVGGYYSVYKVSNSIESGQFETRLSLMRVMGRGGTQI